jgi:Chondroitinase B
LQRGYSFFMIVLRFYLRRYRLLLIVALSLWLCLLCGESVWAATYYISPGGNDQQDGAARESAWATFAHAWTVIQPGDTLIVLDGIYNQGIEPQVNGTPDAPIIVRADRDGQAFIDGQDQRIPVYLYRDYYIIEGIVARNGNHTVYFISGSNNILRRVSGYDANLDVNSDVFAIYDSHNNLIEDCLAAGTGRKMVLWLPQ